MEFTIVLQNKTPIFSAAPGASTISLDGRIGAPNGFPLTRQRTLRVPVRTEGAAVTMRPVPLVPGNTLRNLLRRSALDTIFGRFAEEGKTLEIGAYAAAYSGNASGNPEGVSASFDESYAVRAHPFLGLFGGGPRMIRGRLRVDSMYPVCHDTQELIGEGFEELAVNDALTEVIWVRRCDPIEKNSPEHLSAHIKDAPAAITAWALAGAENKAKRKNTKDETNASDEKIGRGLNAFNAHEVVSPGLYWVWRVRLEQPSDEQAGLVLASIINIAEREMAVAGGHAKDYGQVRIDSISVDGKSVYAGGHPSESGQQLLDSFAEALDSIRVEDFESFVKPSKA